MKTYQFGARTRTISLTDNKADSTAPDLSDADAAAVLALLQQRSVIPATDVTTMVQPEFTFVVPPATT